jgi:hypothetical protein
VFASLSDTAIVLPSLSSVVSDVGLDVAVGDALVSDPVVSPTGTQASGSAACAPKRRPLSHASSGKLQEPFASHSPIAPHCTSVWQTKLLAWQPAAQASKIELSANRTTPRQ